MATIKKSVKSKTDFITCHVSFSAAGVKLDFKPKPKANGNNETISLTKADFDVAVGAIKNPGPIQAGDPTPKIPNGAFNRKEHQRNVSRNRPTKFAFCLAPGSAWGFVKSGFALKTSNGKTRFNSPVISANGKVVEVTFSPEKKAKNYGYELWLQADVVNPGVAQEDRATVTVIVDPVIRSSSVP